MSVRIESENIEKLPNFISSCIQRLFIVSFMTSQWEDISCQFDKKVNGGTLMSPLSLIPMSTNTSLIRIPSIGCKIY